ncbi:DoxX family membrane protein [Candidatus Uhrbacteria bacterium]|nr:MAG: DoxX family membrane protein [Candidatus Uhrbacteria bacterium]
MPMPVNQLSFSLNQRRALFLLRVSMGWLFFYAGIVKVLNPAWSAAGYLKGAKSFAAIYGAMLHPAILPVVNFMNEWGLTLLGVSLLLGIFVRASTALGIVLMILYYLALDFPKPNPNAFIVDEHIIYVFGLLVLHAFRAGRVWGLEPWCASLPVCSKYPKLREWLG